VPCAQGSLGQQRHWHPQVDLALLRVEDQRRLGIKEPLPSTLEAAMHHLDKDGALKAILEDKLVDTYLAVKA
jgi:glutamine synthetase